MILILLIVVLLIGGIGAWIIGKRAPLLSRIVSLVAVAIDFVIVLIIAISGSYDHGAWMIDYNVIWISQFGISFHFALDGLSLLMLLLTFFLGLLAVIISWKEIDESVGFFH